ncbi:MAG: hypothetical protein P3A33_09850 [Gemmatimonadota bacterium]|nr:hypothetical protein [Gemmatimonadota bacterium]
MTTRRNYSRDGNFRHDTVERTSHRALDRLGVAEHDLTGDDRKYADRRRNWAWGLPVISRIEVDDPDYPDHIIECGRMVEFGLLNARTNPASVVGGKPDFTIRIQSQHVNESHLGFDGDLDHRNTNLYIVTPKAVQEKVREKLYDRRNVVPFADLAQLAGGRHADDVLVRTNVTPIGPCHTITYYTHKRGDDPASNYRHEFGEEHPHAPVKPILCVDSRGRFWLAGGDYTVPNPGITN